MKTPRRPQAYRLTHPPGVVDPRFGSPQASFQTSINITLYLDYFYEGVAVCTTPTGKITDLKSVSSLFNVTAEIITIENLFNSTVAGLNLTALVPSFNIDFKYRAHQCGLRPGENRA